MQISSYKNTKIKYNINIMKHIKGVQELTADKLSRTNINDILPKVFETDKIFNLYDDNISGAFN